MYSKSEQRAHAYLYSKRFKPPMGCSASSKYCRFKGNRNTYIVLFTNIFCIVAFLALQQVTFAAMKISEVDQVMKEVVYTSGATEWTVKPNGPVSPIMFYLRDKNIDAFSIRLISPNINLYYSMLDKNSNTCFKRNSAKDSVYLKDKDGKKVLKEIIDHYSTLLDMFPSPKNKISIFPKEGCTDSFTLFLKSDPVKKYANTILAALLLMAEKIDVPLSLEEVDGRLEKLVWKGGADCSEHFSLDMFMDPCQYLYSKNCKRLRHNKKYQKKAVNTIQYFIGLKQAEVFLHEMEVKSIYSIEHWIDDILGRESWLIQLYIIFYIETPEDAKNFNRTLYIMLDRCIELNKEKDVDMESKRAAKFFKRCFARSDRDSETVIYWENLKELKRITTPIKNVKLLPFTDPAMFPIKKRARLHLYRNIYFSQDVFLTDLESALHGIFCCFAYDSNSDVYRVDHIPNVLEEVKNFFPMPFDYFKYVYDRPYNANYSSSSYNLFPSNSDSVAPGKKTSEGVYPQWKKMIKNIKIKDIEYMSKNSKIIKSGLLNMLTIILTLAGRYNGEDKKKIQDFRNKVKGMENAITNAMPLDLLTDLETYISNLFTSLSRDCVACRSMPIWYEDPLYLGEKRQVFVKFIVLGEYKAKSASDLCGNLEIYYAHDRQAKPIIVHLMNVKTAYLELGMPIIKLCITNEKERHLRNSIDKIPLDNMVCYCIFAYARNIKQYITDSIILDLYMRKFENNGVSQMRLACITAQPYQYLSTQSYTIIEFVKNNSCRGILLIEGFNYSDLRSLGNLIIFNRLNNLDVQLLLLICIGCRKSHVQNSLKSIEKVSRKYTGVYRDDISEHTIAEIVKCLVKKGLYVDSANVIAAYTQIFAHRDAKCASKIFKLLSYSVKSKVSVYFK
ncbi:hypothetical protein NEAUS06_1416 [Nematocida ausubeli]|nr:hypothetical protein NEAUS06_1416 [Nematocida ausubeli]